MTWVIIPDVARIATKATIPRREAAGTSLPPPLYQKGDSNDDPALLPAILR